jgi:hypothetical protein
MLPKPPRDMTESILREGCGQWPESQTLDFKQELPASDPRDGRSKNEFLKDVCAFANADGGDLVYGVSEQDGVAKDILPILGQPEDTLRRRLTQVLDAGLEPRVSGVVMEPVAIETGGFVLVVRVPPSFDSPHRYRHDNYHRFVVRNGTLISDMTYDQLRTAFDRSATLVERAKQFRVDRVNRVTSGITWSALAHGPLGVVHLLPIAALSARSPVDVGALHDGNYMAFAQQHWGNVTTRTLSIDGLLVHPQPANDSPLASYTHVFRSGSVEALRYMGHPTLQGIVPSTSLAVFVRETVHKLAVGLAALGFTGPAIVGVSLVRLAGARLGLGDRYSNNASATADRSELLVPEEWIGALVSVDLDPIVRRMLDTLWQCFDEPRCLEFDANGNWNPQPLWG